MLLVLKYGHIVLHKYVWALQDDPNRTKVVSDPSISEQMVACFVNRACRYRAVPLEQCRTVSSHLYTTTCLPERRIIPHHDNARSHTSSQTNNFWALKILNRWVICHSVLIWYPMTSFYSLIKNELWGWRLLMPLNILILLLSLATIKNYCILDYMISVYTPEFKNSIHLFLGYYYFNLVWTLYFPVIFSLSVGVCISASGSLQFNL